MSSATSITVEVLGAVSLIVLIIACYQGVSIRLPWGLLRCACSAPDPSRASDRGSSRISNASDPTGNDRIIQRLNDQVETVFGDDPLDRGALRAMSAETAPDSTAYMDEIRTYHSALVHALDTMHLTHRERMERVYRLCSNTYNLVLTKCEAQDARVQDLQVAVESRLGALEAGILDIQRLVATQRAPSREDDPCSATLGNGA